MLPSQICHKPPQRGCQKAIRCDIEFTLDQTVLSLLSVGYNVLCKITKNTAHGTPSRSRRPLQRRNAMLQQGLDKLKSSVKLRSKYDNFIGGEWVAPVAGQYLDNISPITGKAVCQVAHSQAADIEVALDAAHKAKDKASRTPVAERAALLEKIADRVVANLDVLALAETIDNGKPIRETTAADMPLTADHFRYFAACARAQEGSLSEIDHNTIAYHFHEPLGVVGQIIPWNFPVLMAAWKLAPALAAGNCV